MVLRMAISACLSVTTMTSMEIILNAATAMINDNMTHMTVFSVRTAWNRLPRSWLQSLTRYAPSNWSEMSRATSQAVSRSFSFSRIPPMESSGIRSNLAASSICTIARPLSFSYSPNSNIPTTVKRFISGLAPKGLALSRGAMTVTLSPRPTRRRTARPIPSTIPYSPVRRSASSPLTMLVATSDTVASKSGTTPRTSAALEPFACNQAPTSIYGADATTSSCVLTCLITSRQSSSGLSSGWIVA